MTPVGIGKVVATLLALPIFTNMDAVLRGMENLTALNWVTLLLGSGIFVTLLRVVFNLGQYSQKVTHLEETLLEMNQQWHAGLEELKSEVKDLRRERLEELRVKAAH